MKLNIYLTAFLVISTLIGCGSSTKIVEPTAKSRQLDQWVAEKDFEINSEWAIPMLTNSMSQVSNAGLFPPGSAANRINLTGNSNYLKVNGMEVEASLPYYGERQVGGGYGNTNSGIVFSGRVKEYESVKDEDKLKHQITFRVMNNTEVFDVAITLYPNLKSEIIVNSSQRLVIRYEGRVKSKAEGLP
ncbi:MAG: DUF4251 domain-containing protein [Flavobacteriaceae bacterium]